MAANGDTTNCDITAAGRIAVERLGIDVDDLLDVRRKFAFACLDWSERRPHLGGALAAAILRAFIRHRWVARELDSRVLRVTSEGRRELQRRIGVTIPQEKRWFNSSCARALEEVSESAEWRRLVGSSTLTFGPRRAEATAN